jgi:UDPglucose 6-dehydrogenase
MVALTIESCGHEVKGHDIDPAVAGYLRERAIPFREDHAEELLRSTRMEMVSLKELCAWAEILFLAPQTPHESRFEGVTPLPADRADFDYSYLKEAVKEVNACLPCPTTCVVISTVLPGTIERVVKPLLGRNFLLIYEPLFIAMGTVYQDFLNPEFVLCGTEHEEAYLDLLQFYDTIGMMNLFRTDIRTAEGIKVFYNTFITAKTVLGNLYGEMAHRLGMNVDDIYKALCLAKDRLISPKYLKAGMGDGGGCHPRDNIALSYIAKTHGLSFDFFEALMVARQKHCEWLADMCEDESREWGLPIRILGKEFKPETNIRTGSPAILLYNILSERGVAVRIIDNPEKEAAVYFIGCQHTRYRNCKFPSGSVVIDPFRYIQGQEGVHLVSIGSGKEQLITA